jgi:hypothetical protein
MYSFLFNVSKLVLIDQDLCNHAVRSCAAGIKFIYKFPPFSWKHMAYNKIEILHCFFSSTKL